MPSVAILTLPEFNEVDSFVAYHMLNRATGVDAFLAGPEPEVVSFFGTRVHIDHSLEDALKADAVIVGSGRLTRKFAKDADFLEALKFRPETQIVASQCSGALILARLGLLQGLPVCTDNMTRPWIEELGLTVLDKTLSVNGNIATAGGCLGAQQLAAWILCRLVGEPAARDALAYVAPIGEGDDFVSRLIQAAKQADQGR
tara:strand:- start:1880 stop:2482 length:603 start_codon:yes stop_codon:yes gene_type:complete